MKKLVGSNPVAQRFDNRASEKASEGGYCDAKFMESIRELIPSEIVSDIRQGVIEFIKINRNHLPMYYLPPAIK